MTAKINKDYEKAVYYFTEAIKIRPDQAAAYYNRGLVYSKMREWTNAIPDYDKAIKLDPNYAQAYINRGAAWLHKEGWDKAKSDLTTARDMGSDIVASFHNDYENVAHFEQKTGIKMPDEIAAMLTDADSEV